jgi:hypothetical protein
VSKLVLSGDTSGSVTLDAPAVSGTTTLTLPTTSGTIALSGGAVSGTTGSFSGDLSFNSGYGSAAVAYGCRAWVNFNGTGTVAIRASGNVTSITDNGTGDYTVNFTNAMPNANYAFNISISDVSGNTSLIGLVDNTTAPTTSATRIKTRNGATGNSIDLPYISFLVVR